MPLLLTSDGLSTPRITAVFASLLPRPDTARVALHMTASHNDTGYRNVCLEELRGAGIRDIRTREMDHAFLPQEFADVDAVYVAGGNTFYLLQQMRACRFHDALLPFLERTGTYVGVSAGSIVVGPDITAAGLGTGADENDVGLTDLTGLGVVDCVITPHFDKKDAAVIEEYERKLSHRIVRLKDGETLLVQGREEKIIA